MLDINNTRYNDTNTEKVVSTALSIEAGAGLVNALEDGVFKVVPATGAAGEVFAGVAFHELTAISQATFVERVTVPLAGGTVVLQKVPLGAATDIRIVETTSGGLNVAAQAGAAAAGQVQFVGPQSIDFNIAEAGIVVDVTYRYNLTVVEAQALQGDGVAGRSAHAVTETIGVIRKGIVFTDQFATGQDWLDANIADVTLDASGIFTRGGAGAAVSCRIVSAPSVDSPFLGLYFSA